MRYGAHHTIYFCKVILLEHQGIYFMNKKVIPSGLAVFSVGAGWASGDLYVKENEQHCGFGVGQNHTWLGSLFSVARCPLCVLSVTYQPGALVNFHAEEVFETQASFMLWEDLRGVNPV